MTWYDSILKKMADLRNIVFKKIGSLGFDGWFYIFSIMVMTQIMSVFIPMITVVLFSSCFLWFINWVKWFIFQQEVISWKPVICGFVGTIIGVGLSYLTAIPHEIMWF